MSAGCSLEVAQQLTKVRPGNPPKPAQHGELNSAHAWKAEKSVLFPGRQVIKQAKAPCCLVVAHPDLYGVCAAQETSAPPAALCVAVPYEVGTAQRHHRTPQLTTAYYCLLLTRSSSSSWLWCAMMAFSRFSYCTARHWAARGTLPKQHTLQTGPGRAATGRYHTSTWLISYLPGF